MRAKRTVFIAIYQHAARASLHVTNTYRSRIHKQLEQCGTKRSPYRVLYYTTCIFTAHSWHPSWQSLVTTATRLMKRRLSKGAHIPLIVVHGVRTKDNANRVVDRERYHKRIASLGIAVAGIDLVIRPYVQYVLRTAVWSTVPLM